MNTNLSPSEALKLLQNQVEENLQTPVSAEDEPRNRGSPPSGRSRIWIMLLYPDNPDHAEIIQRVFKDFVCIGALHDQDQGVKEHYHIVFYFPSAVYASHILDKYPKLESRFIYIRKDIKVQVRYLLHLDSPSKFQYPRTYLEGHIEKFGKYIDGDQLEAEQVIKILDWIETSKPYSPSDLLRYVCAEGLYATYRRNAYTFNLILVDSKNDKKRRNQS